MADDARLLLVPHEPTPAHLEALEAALRRHGVGCRRYSALEARESIDTPVVLVDRVGVLAELYALGDVAFIGGAFSSGVHNLLEPAVLGLPVLFGPRHHNAPEADLLLDSGAAAVIRSPADLARWLVELRSNPERRRTLGGRARASVEANLGAADRCLERLLPHLGAPPVRETSS
jgi:3-deoxy-D-manno-octulosonic-acid transferase